jgi:hypothetical protein
MQSGSATHGAWLDDVVDAVEPALDVEQFLGGLALHQSNTASRRMSSSIFGFNPP